MQVIESKVEGHEVKAPEPAEETRQARRPHGRARGVGQRGEGRSGQREAGQRGRGEEGPRGQGRASAQDRGSRSKQAAADDEGEAEAAGPEAGSARPPWSGIRVPVAEPPSGGRGRLSGDAARALPPQARLREDARACRRDLTARPDGPVRHPAPPRDPAPLRLPPRDRGRPRQLGRPQRPDARSRRRAGWPSTSRTTRSSTSTSRA